MTLVETSLAKSPSLVDGWRFKGELLVAQGQVEPGLAAYR
jgi:cytochrome c-type biogenesis protein CcmH/NrfG